LRAPVVTLDVGPLPRPSLGIAAGAGLHAGAWSFFARGQLSASQHVASDAFPGYGADVARVAGSAWACRGLRIERLELAPCVALWLEHVRARGTGADLAVSKRQRFTWVSPAAGAVGHYRIADWLAVSVSASGRLEGARPRLSVAGLGEIHRLGPLALSLAAGPEWIF
jgi:hypothetical protein